MSVATGDLVFLSARDDVWFPTQDFYMLAVAETDSHHLCFMYDGEFADAQLQSSGKTNIASLRVAGLPLRSLVAVRRNLLAMTLPIPAYFPVAGTKIC